MNTKQKLRTIAALTAVGISTSFTQPAASSQHAPFTGKYWLLESSTVSPAIDLNMDGKPDTDIRVMQEDCEKDDAEMYKSDGKLMKNNGSRKCDDEEEAVEESGTWKYNAATKEITVHHYNTEKPQTVILKEVSGNKMVLSYTFKSTKATHIITAIYKAK